MSILAQALAERYKRYLKPFEGHAQEILDLLAMHPHIDEILDGRTVEAGENSNGYYYRWGSGMQVCFGQIDYDMNNSQFKNYPMPASFSSRVGLAGGLSNVDEYTDTRIREIFLTYVLRTTRNQWRIRDYAESSPVEGTVKMNVFAIGRWK